MGHLTRSTDHPSGPYAFALVGMAFEANAFHSLLLLRTWVVIGLLIAGTRMVREKHDQPDGPRESALTSAEPVGLVESRDRMSIVIDGRMLSWTGIGRYTLALLEELEAIDQTNDYVVLTRRSDWSRWVPRANNFTRLECNIGPYTLAEQTKLPRILNDLAPDVVHFVTPNAAVLYTRRKVVTLHDLTLFDFDTGRGSTTKRLLSKLKRIPFRRSSRGNSRRPPRVATVSGYVQSQLIERFKLDRGKVSTVWLAADAGHLTQAAEEPLPSLGGLDASLLYVGNYSRTRTSVF